MRTRALLTFLFVAALVVLPAAQAQAATTIIGCTGTPTTDGNNLRTTYNGTAGSATAPSVIILSACVYDLGTNTLNLKSFVDLVGYDRNDAIVISQIDNGTSPNTGTITVGSGVDAEIANVTIRNDETSCYGVYNSSSLLVLDSVIVEATCEEDAVGVFTDGRIRINDSVIRADVDGEEVLTARAVGIEDDGGSSVVSDTLVSAFGAGCTSAFGALLDGASSIFDQVSLFVDCPGGATGIDLSGSSAVPQISNSKAIVDASSGDAVGVDLAGTSNSIRLVDTWVEADTGGSNAIGVRNTSSSSSLRLFNVTAFTFNATNTIGAQVSAGLLNSDRSTLSGSTNSFNVATGAQGKFGASKLVGTRGTAGTVACVASYDAAYAAVPTTC